MKKSLIYSLMAVVSAGIVAGNVSLAEDGITYNTGANITYTDTNGKVFTGIGTITITSGDESITILDRNLGATMAGYGSDALEESYGNHFQWGNNYGFIGTGDLLNVVQDMVSISGYSWSNPYVSSGFVKSVANWADDNNAVNLRGVNGYEYTRQGPCPIGYHVPTVTEWNNVISMMTSRYKPAIDRNHENVITFMKDLLLPLANYRHWGNAKITSSFSAFWTTTAFLNGALNTEHSYRLFFDGADRLTTASYQQRANAHSIRCFKDTEDYVALNFDTMGGTSMQSQTVPMNGSGHVPGYEPIKTGFTFEGWYTDLTFKNLAFDDETYFTTFMLTGDTTIYAKWNQNTVTFTGLDENIVDIIVDFGSGITKPIVSIPGYRVEWYIDSEFTTGWNFSEDVVKYDITLYAKKEKLDINDSLILHYTFDGDSVVGYNVIDQSSQNNTGTANEGVKFNGGGSAEFNGTGVITFNDYGNLIRETNAGTVSLRVKSGTGNQIIIGSSYGPALGFYNNKYLIGFSAPSNSRPQGIISGLSSGRNYFVAVLSGESINYYINDEKLKRDSGQAWTWTSEIGMIGARWNGTIPFSGYLDEIRVYNRVLSEDEIKTLYASGFNAGNIECSISYARNLENYGYVDVTLNCPVEVRVTSEGKSSGHMFRESGSYTFEYDYGWNTGSMIASVSGYNIQFVAGDNGTLSGNTKYSVLVRNDESDFESLGIAIPEIEANSGYVFSGWTPEEPISGTIVNSDLTFTAEFKEVKNPAPTPEEPTVSGRSGGGGHRHISNEKSDLDGEVEVVVDKSLYDSKYSDEMNEAYLFAYENGITTMNPISKADMNGGLTRIAMAKMLSQYAINVLGKAPANLIVPKFVDVTEEMNENYGYGVSLAYQLGIMGINMPENKFRPNDKVTRGEFGTALSRMIYGISDGEEEYYSTHLDKLYEEGVISNKDAKLEELRGYVMLMLMRSAK